jgi:hypothetical protein
MDCRSTGHMTHEFRIVFLRDYQFARATPRPAYRVSLAGSISTGSYQASVWRRYISFQLD